MKICAFYDNHNAPGKNDAEGAFIPQCVRFRKHHSAAGDDVYAFPFDDANPSMKARRDSVLKGILDTTGGFDAFVYFGHGLRRSLPSGGFDLATLPLLGDAIMARGNQTTKHVFVTLYACSTAEGPSGKGDGDGGFADTLRDYLATHGWTGWVDGHTNAAHTTENPFARRFVSDGKNAATGGTWIVEPHTALWDAWHARLLSDEHLRFFFPFMSLDEIHAALAKG